MPIPQDQTVLKSYFETGDTPTQAQFAELIDTMFALVQAAQNTANAAQATANSLAASGALAKVFATVKADGPPVLEDGFGVSSVTSQALSSGQRTVRINFTTPRADNHYTIAVRAVAGTTGVELDVVLVARNAAFIDLKVLDGARLFFVMFDA
jgi:hypothetical protein